MEPITSGVAAVAVTAASGLFGYTVAQANAIGNESAITIGIALSACGAVAWGATRLTNIGRDIKEIKWRLNNLPCQHGKDCPKPDDEE